MPIVHRSHIYSEALGWIMRQITPFINSAGSSDAMFLLDNEGGLDRSIGSAGDDRYKLFTPQEASLFQSTKGLPVVDKS